MVKKIVRVIKNPRIIGIYLRSKAFDLWKPIQHSFVKPRPMVPRPTEFKELEEIRQLALPSTDISDHLVMLFTEALERKPNLIVELGVRGGPSNMVLSRVAKLCGARLISVDIDDCSDVNSDPDWLFVHSDDVAFAEEFPAYCEARGIIPKIDVLFLDTSHMYDHTVQEIKHWFPHLSDFATVLLHDTNLGKRCRHRDGRIMRSHDIQRGVIGPIEDYLGKKFDEGQDFVDIVKPWVIRHYAYSNGFTVMTRLPFLV